MTDDRRKVHIDGDVYGRVLIAAAEETIKDGERVTVTEWVRRACLEKLERDGR